MYDFDHSMDQDKALNDMHRLFEWTKWMKEIPEIPMKRGWKIRVIPPFGGAIVRFEIIRGKDRVSVYLDAYDKMGCMDRKPYWEIHPSDSGDCERFWMNEVKELSNAISKSLDSQRMSRMLKVVGLKLDKD